MLDFCAGYASERLFGFELPQYSLARWERVRVRVLNVMPTNPGVETLRNRARQIRREQTEAEKRLWAVLRARQLQGYKFRRQFVIGSVIVDFCCFENVSCLSSMADNMPSKKQPIKSVPGFYLHAAIVSCGFGTMRF